MPYILYKKTWKRKTLSANEKILSLHGEDDIINEVVGPLNEKLKKLGLENTPIFERANKGENWACKVHHAFLKYHEEDFTAKLLNSMEAMGWEFKRQYDEAVQDQNVVKLTKEIMVFWRKEK